MTRRITETFSGYDMPTIIVTLPDASGIEHEHGGDLRAWAVDDETGDWWGMCQYYVGVGRQMLGWVHETRVRRAADLDDDDGRVATNVKALPQLRI